MKIGLLGLGTVGAGAYEIIENQKGRLQEFYQEELTVERILVRNLNKKRPVEVPDGKLTCDADEILNDPSIDVILSLMGGMEPAKTYILKALQNGKHVITSNKAVVAANLSLFLNEAKKSNVAFLFEGAVGGGIPIIKPLKQQRRLNQIEAIEGILNGTTNFILTQMMENKLEFDTVLADAQARGYAEADPSADIDGFDVQRKIAILSSLAYGQEIPTEKVYTRGIRSIRGIDTDYFQSKNLDVKLVASSAQQDDAISIWVEPCIVDPSHRFYAIKNSDNVVSFIGHLSGRLDFVGAGAGMDPTANAVISDLMDILDNHYQADIIPLAIAKNVGPTHASQDYYLRVDLLSCTKSEQARLAEQLLNLGLANNQEIYQGMIEGIEASMMRAIVSDVEKECGSIFYARRLRG
jgi:homoserine dehydrogenase